MLPHFKELGEVCQLQKAVLCIMYLYCGFFVVCLQWWRHIESTNKNNIYVLILTRTINCQLRRNKKSESLLFNSVILKFACTNLLVIIISLNYIYFFQLNFAPHILKKTDRKQLFTKTVYQTIVSSGFLSKFRQSSTMEK